MNMTPQTYPLWLTWTTPEGFPRTGLVIGWQIQFRTGHAVPVVVNPDEPRNAGGLPDDATDVRLSLDHPQSPDRATRVETSSGNET